VAGLNPAFNPLWRMLDKTKLGIAGHSYGAQAASWLAQQEPRVKAVVAWDTLCLPAWPSPDELNSIAGAPINRIAGLVPGGAPYGFAPWCFGAPAGPTPRLRKPPLGLSGDYLIQPVPYVTAPDPQAKNLASLSYSRAGVDSGQIAIRGGEHIDFAGEPTGIAPASLRGIDMTTWYTTAWFDKYLKHDPTADARLLTARWRDDAAAQSTLHAIRISTPSTISPASM
jgi:pimeloyl-ACP methyl ester carboxylesterase